MTGTALPTIREATLADLGTIADFNQAMAQETEGRALPRQRLEAGIRTLLADRGHGFYLLAERERVIVGQLMVTYEWSDWKNAPYWWIQSVHVHAGHRRTGVYSALHHETARRARDAGACALRLYVERDNAVARRTYEELGMSHAQYDMFEFALGGSH